MEESAKEGDVEAIHALLILLPLLCRSSECLLTLWILAALFQGIMEEASISSMIG